MFFHPSEGGVAAELVGQCAPGGLHRARFAVWPENSEALKHVEFIKGQDRHPRPGRFGDRHSRKIQKLANRRMDSERGALFGQMEERDEGVGLTTTIGDLNVLNGFAALAREAVKHITDQGFHLERGVRAGEESHRIPVDLRRLARTDSVQIGGELVERQRAGANVSTDFAELMPGLERHWRTLEVFYQTKEIAHGAIADAGFANVYPARQTILLIRPVIRSQVILYPGFR